MHRGHHDTTRTLLGMALALVLIVGEERLQWLFHVLLSSTGGTVTVLMGTAPDSLDPGLGFTTQSYEATWLTYTGLVTYARASPGQRLVIAGLAEALPRVSSDGKTYTFVLRKGLVYSDGTPVKASDFTHTIERAIKLGWGEKELLTENIVGGEAFDKGKSSTISGIQADNATGAITIRLGWPLSAEALLERVGLPRGRSRAEQHSDEKPPQHPPAGRRSL